MELASPTTGRGHRSFHPAAGVAVVLCFLSTALAYAYYFIFSRGMSLDEGYLMITVQGFLDGHALYDNVFTQYGPFYYFYESILHGLWRVPLTHDATRFLCLVHWSLAATIFGLAGWVATRSFFAALFIAVQTFAHLASLAQEPGHPQELVAVLLAFGMLAAARFPHKQTSIPLAVITALLAFTKINVGVFFGFGLLLATTCRSSTLPAQRLWNWLLLAACVALPFLLVRRHLAAEWSRNYAVVLAITTFATLFVAQRFSVPSVSMLRRLVHLVAIGSFCSAALLAGTLLSGSSWQGIVEGLFITPLKMPSVAYLPVAMPTPVLINAVVALFAAIALALNRSNTRVASLLTALKAALGIVGAFVFIGRAPAQLAYLLPWGWLVAMPASREENYTAHEKFFRGFLAVASAWQALQAYPVAGTQITLATLLLVFGCAICLHDVWKVIIATRLHQITAAWPATRMRLVGALALLGLFFLFVNHWCSLPNVRREYAKLRPLGLEGSTNVRMDDETVTLYTDVSSYLRAESDAFVTYPGINSLYFWTGQRPPTQINSTGWGQLTYAQQEKILASLQHAKRPRLLVVEAALRTWQPVAPEPILPLVRFVSERCRPERRIGRFIVFTLKSENESAAR